jgi:hypothetical protein
MSLGVRSRDEIFPGGIRLGYHFKQVSNFRNMPIPTEDCNFRDPVESSSNGNLQMFNIYHLEKFLFLETIVFLISDHRYCLPIGGICIQFSVCDDQRRHTFFSSFLLFPNDYTTFGYPILKES